MKITDEAVKTAALKLVEDLDLLMRHSEGVAGLHQNGDIAPWEEITEGGEFGDWLSSIENLRSAIQKDPPHLQAGYAVKQLEWAWDPHERCHYAKTQVGLFKVDISKSLFLGTCLLSRKFKKIAEAKDAAQAEFECIVRECIDGGVDVAALEAKHDKEMTEVIKDRDQVEAWADKLAYAIGGEGIGEHSSINNPWENALEIAETRKPVDATEVRRQALEEVANICDQSAALSQEQHDKAGSHSYIKATLKGEVVAAKALSGRIRALIAAPSEEAEVRGQVLEGGEFEILSDIKPHLRAWRAALFIAERAAVSCPPNIDDKAYWRHEIKALEDISDKLNVLLVEPA